MAKKIIWSRRAQNDRKEILSYWLKRNKTNTYSKKLNGLFIEAVKIISDYPDIGKITDEGRARIKIVGDYIIIYEIEKETILLLTIWDSRQNPEKLKEILKK